MRSSRDGRHVSGAERLAEPEELPALARAMTRRALTHDKGRADDIHVTVERIDPESVSTVPALRTAEVANPTPGDARALIAGLLCDAGVPAADEVVRLAHTLTGLRGAAIVDAATGERLDPDPARGVRVSTFDAVRHPSSAAAKDHFHEALILASKVQSAPGVIAEVCISDDPRYTRGYVSTPGVYHRVPGIKPDGSELGTRVIAVAPGTDVGALVEYLENAPVLVDLPGTPSPTTGATAAPADATAAPAPQSLDDLAAARNDEWRRRGLARDTRTFATAQLPRSIVDGREYLLFSSSDYLGLSTDPAVVDAATAATRTFGTGSGGSRLTTGTSLHGLLEAELAEFFGYPDAVLFATGYQANHSTIGAVARAVADSGSRLHVFSDADNHASIIDGCRAARAAGADLTVFPHADHARLDELLAQSTAGHALVVTDAVFSMSGDVADLAALEDVCRRHGAWLMADDAHGVGVIGDHGRGTADRQGARPELVVGTASKALGAEGGFVLCSGEVGTLLRNRARSFVYSTSMNPGSVAAIRAGLAKLRDGGVVTRLRANIDAVRAAAGLPADAGASAIIPLPVGDEDAAVAMSARLAERGVFIPAIRYPTVPRGAAMLRLTVTAAHTGDDIDELASALAAVGFG